MASRGYSPEAETGNWNKEAPEKRSLFNGFVGSKWVIMRLNDVRILWARSGNRCAFPDCNIEMAPAGLKTSLGEIAHIVAKRDDGPRGRDP